MLFYDRIDISEGIYANKTSKSKRVIFVTIGIFSIRSLSFNHKYTVDLSMVSMNLRDIAILKTKNSDYCFIISGIKKSKAINLMENIDLTEKKVEHYKKLNIRGNFEAVNLLQILI